jgi:phosphomannomutase
MRQLSSLMRWLDADLGAAVNVDGDRVGFVASGGRALSEEYVLPLTAMLRLRRRRGNIVTNLSSSRMTDAIAERLGHRVLRATVGESHVIDQGIAEAAVLAGEGNGGVAALPASMTFDGLLALGYVLELIAVTGTTLADLATELPAYVMSKRQLPCPPNLVYKVLDRFRLRYGEFEPDCTDGVRVAWPDAWLHVRASNTEPLLRIIAEAETRERTASIMEGALAFARRMTYGPGGS